MGMYIYVVRMYGITISGDILLDKIKKLQLDEKYKHLFYDDDGNECSDIIDEDDEDIYYVIEILVDNLIKNINKNLLGYKFDYVIDSYNDTYFIGSNYHDMPAYVNRYEFESYINKVLYDIFNIESKFQSDEWAE